MTTSQAPVRAIGYMLAGGALLTLSDAVVKTPIGVIDICLKGLVRDNRFRQLCTYLNQKLLHNP